MSQNELSGRIVLVTGAARRIGRTLALACARAGADVVIHYGKAGKEATLVKEEIVAIGRQAWTIGADLRQSRAAADLVTRAGEQGPLYALVNSAAIFEPLSLQDTGLADWERHLAINLTAPFLLSQAFARQVPQDGHGRIVNILDWRALRPGADHFPYTVSKSALAAMTRSLAAALAPSIPVNGLALGALLPPSTGTARPDILKDVPAERWGELSELEEALIFLLAGPAYITGEIIHLDGGRHLV
jgi:pteridine reductase